MKALLRSAIVAAVFVGFVGVSQPAAAQTPSVDVRIGHYRPHYRHGHRMHVRYHRQYARAYRSYARYYRSPSVGYHQRQHKKRYLRWY